MERKPRWAPSGPPRRPEVRGRRSERRARTRPWSSSVSEPCGGFVRSVGRSVRLRRRDRAVRFATWRDTGSEPSIGELESARWLGERPYWKLHEYQEGSLMSAALQSPL